MAIYWIMFILPMLFTLHPVRVSNDLRRLAFWLIGILFILIIGLRHEIGGDWDRYISIYAHHLNSPFNFQNFTSGDYVYESIHWFSLNYLNGVYFTNLICALIFMSGLIRFCRTMPTPWLAFLVSIPFLVIVVSMGYTRQGAAVGFLLLALVDLTKGRSFRFYIYIIIGALFHKVLLIMIPIGYLYNMSRFKILNFITVFSLLLISGYFLLFDRIAHMFYYYITIKFHDSGGALIRVFMGFVSAIIFFAFRGKFKEKFYDEKLWLIFSVISVVLFPASYFYTTFIDRITIFFLPLQLVVLSRIPILIQSKFNREIFILGVLVVYSSALFVWLNFGNHSNEWLPYQNILLEY